MKTLLMFVDESMDSQSLYSQVSGFYITVQNYLKLRHMIYSDFLDDLHKDSPMHILGYKTNYTRKNFCTEFDDKHKAKKFRYLLSTIYRHAFLVFCVGLHCPEGFPMDIKNIPYYTLSDAWFVNLHFVRQIARENIILPVIDLGLDSGFRKQYKLYSDLINSVVSCTVRNCEKDSLYAEAKNIVEPLYSVDEYSVGIQMADILGSMKLLNNKLTDTQSNSLYKSIMKREVGRIATRKKTMCLFMTRKYDDLSRKGWNEYHDSYWLGSPYSGHDKQN